MVNAISHYQSVSRNNFLCDELRKRNWSEVSSKTTWLQEEKELVMKFIFTPFIIIGALRAYCYIYIIVKMILQKWRLIRSVFPISRYTFKHESNIWIEKNALPSAFHWSKWDILTTLLNSAYDVHPTNRPFPNKAMDAENKMKIYRN